MACGTSHIRRPRVRDDLCMPIVRRTPRREGRSDALHDFTKAVVLEAVHQRERWPDGHDANKGHEDWFWLIGYLAGKALRPEQSNEKRLHRIITIAAAAANWHAQAAERRECAGCGAGLTSEASDCTGDQLHRRSGRSWAVTVEREGEQVVSIGTNELSGRNLDAADEEAIHTAALHLLSFLGKPLHLSPSGARADEKPEEP
jgi:hypothetical protein